MVDDGAAEVAEQIKTQISDDYKAPVKNWILLRCY